MRSKEQLITYLVSKLHRHRRPGKKPPQRLSSSAIATEICSEIIIRLCCHGRYTLIFREVIENITRYNTETLLIDTLENKGDIHLKIKGSREGA